MKTRQSSLATVIMAFFVMHGPAGRTGPPQLDHSALRKSACELIESSLQRTAKETDAAEQIAYAQRPASSDGLQQPVRGGQQAFHRSGNPCWPGSAIALTRRDLQQGNIKTILSCC